MKTAQQLRKENIAEYLLYMWQIEDVLRACKCNMEVVRKHILPGFPEADRPQEEQWLGELCDMMHREAVTEHGHLQINKNVLQDVTELHNVLLASHKFPYYNAAYYNTLPFIVELRSKADKEPAPEIETCFNALYGELMLKLQHKAVSEGTQEAMKTITQFIAMLAGYYADEKEGKLKLDDET
ncbi:MAG: DUF4924 family protein [Bacteroidaceae bacterium]|nr:DUF4924 family protein [Bacteroidaceae bacterium]